MTIDKNDPRLTAFALGELPREETAELEAALKNDPALQAEVDAIRAVADKLKTTLAEEPLPKAEPVRPLEIEKKSSRFRRRLALYASGVAAVVVLVGLIVPAMQPARDGGGRIAMHNSTDAQHAGSESGIGQKKKDPAEVQNELAELVEQFNLKMEKKNYAEAEIIAKRAVELAPDNVTSRQLMLNAKFIRKFQNNQNVVKSSEHGFLDQLQSVEESSVGFQDREPILYPSANDWKKLSERRANLPALKDTRASGKKESIAGRKPLAGKPASKHWGYYGSTPNTTSTRPSTLRPTTPSPYQSPMRGRDKTVSGEWERSVATGMSAPGVFSADLDNDGNGTDVYAPPMESPAEPKPAAGPPSNQISEIQVKELGRPGKPHDGIITWVTPPKELGRPGKPHDGIITWVTPRIVIMEEEERLGVIPKTPEALIRHRTGPHNTEAYDKIIENEFKRVAEHPLSTFSIDVDTASYSMVRKMLTQGRMPVPGAVRLEELIN